MTALHARKALLPDGWATDVRIDVAGGRIAAVAQTPPADGMERLGIVVPGLCNAHSHAFQRAMAGHTETRGPDEQDNFWSWRERMYELARHIDAAALTAIARQAYCEMVAAGYTAVVEFHYLHTEPSKPAAKPAKPGHPSTGASGHPRTGNSGGNSGHPRTEITGHPRTEITGHPRTDAMFDALRQAARDAGIRLTYVPVLYERGGFDDAPLNDAQHRFAQTLPAFLAHYRRCRGLADEDLTVGIGAHSLRAVRSTSLEQLVATASADAVPLHLHIAEQQREVEQCLAVLQRRPVRWLLEHFDVDGRWCLVHATNVDADELAALAATGAVICLCPSTEANLGDGLFPLAKWLEQGGRIAIGSDSHVTINPFEELRWLEYGQRLAAERRNVAAIGGRHTGRSLFERAAAGGSAAAGIDAGRLAPGTAADLVVLDDEDPMLVGHDAESILDALVFSGFSLPIDRVMVGGRWRVRNGRHAARDQARRDFARVVHGLRGGLP